MGNFTSVHYHLVFTVQDREPLFIAELEERIWAYIAGLAKSKSVRIRAVGGVEDHLHILCDIPTTQAVSQTVGLIKGASSHGLKDLDRRLSAFSWQDGFAGFTVSPTALGAVNTYIRRQRVHHTKKTLTEELKWLEQSCPINSI